MSNKIKHILSLLILTISMSSCNDNQRGTNINVYQEGSNVSVQQQGGNVSVNQDIADKNVNQQGPNAIDQNDGYEVIITSPKDFSRVSRDLIVTGRATVPTGIHVWALARRHDFEPLWWPQREVKVNQMTNQWETTVDLGEPRDVGWHFDIGIITVDAKGQQMLMDYWMNALQSGDWRPIQIPETTSPPKVVKVKKIRH